MNVRTPAISWAQAPAPSWFPNARRLLYEGPFTVYAPGSPALTAPLRVTFDGQQLGGQWVRYIQHVEMPKATGVVATVTGESGGRFGITESNELHRIDYLYDTRNGILSLSRVTDRGMNTVLELRLVGV